MSLLHPILNPEATWSQAEVQGLVTVELLCMRVSCPLTQRKYANAICLQRLEGIVRHKRISHRGDAPTGQHMSSQLCLSKQHYGIVASSEPRCDSADAELVMQCQQKGLLRARPNLEMRIFEHILQEHIPHRVSQAWDAEHAHFSRLHQSVAGLLADKYSTTIVHLATSDYEYSC